MWFRNIFDFAKAGHSPTRASRRGDERKQLLARRLLVEALEARSLLASLTMVDVSLVEGDTGTQYAAVAVKLDASSTRTVTVNYGTIDATASAGSDYDAVSGKLTFSPGETAKTIVVPVRGDRLGEANETLAVTLWGAKNAKIADGRGVVTLIDNEPRVSIDNAVVTEGNAGTTLAEVTVRLSAAYDASVSVNYATADGLATTADSDYAASSGRLTFAPGEISKTILVPVIGDRLHEEGTQDFSVNLSDVSTNALIANGAGSVTITDDEPRLSIQSTWAYEFTGYITFTISLTNAYDEEVTVNFATENGYAVAGEDYLASTGTLTFAPGESSKSITIALYVDSNPEPSETFYMVLSGASSNALIIKDHGTGVGQIYDAPDPIYGDLYGP